MARHADVYQVDDGDKFLVVYGASGAYDYRDRSKIGNPEYGGVNLDEQQAITLASEYLCTHDLALPTEAVTFAQVAHAESGDERGLIPNYWNISYIPLINASTEDTRLVRASGVTVSVQVGGSEVIGVYSNWRDIEAVGTTALYSYDEAKLLALQLGEYVSALPLESPILLYDFEPAEREQNLVLPSYLLLFADAENEIVVPATNLTPRVRISEWSPDSGIQADEPVTFLAEASFGQPPYRFQWVRPSSWETFGQDETFSATNPATTLFHGGHHRVLVEVVDANGVRATDDISINVAGELEPGTPADAQPEPVTPRPVTPRVSDEEQTGFQSVDWLGWTMKAHLTADDGLELTDVAYGGKSMAASLSLPFYEIGLQGWGVRLCELETPSPGPVKDCYTAETTGIELHCGKTLQVQACFKIAGFQAPEDILWICQRYVFDPLEHGCAAPVPLYGPETEACARWHPYIAYQWGAIPDGEGALRASTVAAGEPVARSAASMEHIEFSQRFDSHVKDTRELAGFVKDPEGPAESVLFVPNIAIGTPPLQFEAKATVAAFGAGGAQDNFHIKNPEEGLTGNLISIPGCSIGPWGCAHQHWRWPSVVPKKWWGPAGAGSVLTRNSQGFRVYAVIQRPSETDPPNFDLDRLLDPPESLDGPHTDMVWWLVSRSVSPKDVIGVGAHYFFR